MLFIALLLLLRAETGFAHSKHEALQGQQIWEVDHSLKEGVPIMLANLEQEGKIDILGTTGTQTRLCVFPDFVDDFQKQLTADGTRYEKVVPDLKSFLEEHDKMEGSRMRMLKHRQRCLPNACDKPLTNEYMSFAEMEYYLKNINDPRAKVTSLGKTEEGRDIWLVNIVPSNSTIEKGVFIEGGIHAREWISSAVAFHLIEFLLENADTGKNIEINIVPMANPDGYEFSRETNRLWRKNRAATANRCKGVDLNRNWGFKWGVGASSGSCSYVYKGPKPFSEPETRAVRKAMVQTTNLKFVLALHSYGQLILYPWGWTGQLAPNTAALKSMGSRISRAMYNVNEVQYEVANSASGLYYAGGTTDDWAKGVLGVKYSYTLELRDKGKTGFVLPANQITPTSNEVWGGLKSALNKLRNET